MALKLFLGLAMVIAFVTWPLASSLGLFGLGRAPEREPVMRLDHAEEAALIERLRATRSGPPPPPAGIDRAAGSGPPLFRLADDDSTVFLFGTMHALRPDTPWLTPVVADALDAAEIVVLESIEVLDEGAFEALLAAGRAERPLSEYLAAPEMDALVARLAALGYDRATLDDMTPWLAAETLAALLAEEAGYDPLLGADLHVDAVARARGVPLFGLETLEDQLAVFGGSSTIADIWAIRTQLEDDGAVALGLGFLTEAWLTGDLALLDLAMLATGDDYDDLIGNRNANWVGRIVALLDEPGEAFVAVGAGHFAGPDALQVLLAERGFAVIRVQ